MIDQHQAYKDWMFQEGMTILYHTLAELSIILFSNPAYMYGLAIIITCG